MKASMQAISRHDDLAERLGMVTVGQTASERSASASVSFDERFILRDGNGKPLPDTCYTLKLSSGALRHGTTDSRGRTARYSTSDAQRLSISFGHNQEH